MSNSVGATAGLDNLSVPHQGVHTPLTIVPAPPPASFIASMSVDRDILCALLGSGGVVGPFDEFAVLELPAGADEHDQVWRVDGTPA